MEEAGADALELNIYEVITDPKQAGPAIEQDLVHVVAELKRALKIPIAVKLSPFFTAFGNLAHRLDQAGADGLVLFNRFYQPDFDIDTLAVVPNIEQSTRSELLLRLQWAAILRGRIGASLAICGGIVHPDDAIKAVLAGADPAAFERANYIRTLSSWTGPGTALTAHR